MPPKITNNRWDREPDDFAVVLRERDLSGMFSRRIVIEEGTTGLLMVQGRFDKRLDPGEHVDDPIGMGQQVYDALAKKFMDLIPRRLQETLDR